MKVKQAKQAKQAKQTKQAKRGSAVRGGDERQRTARGTQRRPNDAHARRKPAREQRPLRSGPQTNPIPRPVDAPGRPKNASQAKARAKARKAKAPKVVRPPLRQRILVKLTSIELNPRALVGKVPFVVLVIGALGVGLGTTLWLSTDAAERSYRLSNARETNQALLQQKEALERDVLEAQAAPALAEAARGLGMIPSRDTAHLVQDPAGNWVVVGTPKPAEGVPPPPLNTPLPDAAPPPPPPPGPRVVDPREVTVRMPERAVPTPATQPPGAATVPGVPPAAPVPPVGPAPAAPLGTPHMPTAQALPGPAPAAERSVPLVAPPAGPAA
ncbi:hypothetical protein [Mycobacterium sp. E740]|uniref:hypothetical protein n=1 Tax=Mycobacterium sp. E740 TaxID=1834149 RepID=UPI0007FBBCBE|nr:hypothetical protein [Mycobacterium sp. E740]OBI79473.1 hypothetical protein A5663_19180 [Mycobacterium sp. E740]